ncbi:MAG: S1 RNA-binding domain-containing protein [Planctomycetales bacterium]|nr:S1 RNA-binding domain-containing protein [Planctomycetales bacterium]
MLCLYCLLHFLKKKIGESLQGVISGVVPEGFYVRETIFPADGFLSINSLPSDRYRFERHGQVIERLPSRQPFPPW